MIFTILDCYTDEPAGLGVPNYIGTYPRYIAGAIKELKHDCYYITIDDLRLHNFNKKLNSMKTNISIKNISVNYDKLNDLIKKTDYLIVICGVHTPGKYLSAIPGTLKEVEELVTIFPSKKILTGPAAELGSGLFGGRVASKVTSNVFDYVVSNVEFKLKELLEQKSTDINWNYKNLSKIAILGSDIVKSHPDFPNFAIAEIESSRGCPRINGCSFCTEPLKNEFEKRDVKDINNEILALYNSGIRNFRIGKQSDFFSRSAKEIEQILSFASKYSDILHIDNVNPASVTEEKVKLTVKYCTAGNVAAFGVESFDPKVIKDNNLNSDSEVTLNAIELINKYGSIRGDNGMPKFLPGINIIFGLISESKKTHEYNMENLTTILNSNLLLRRINIREVVSFPGTKIEEVGSKYIKKNQKYYWKWRNEIRQKIDNPMLQKVVPVGTILKKCRTEIHDGKTTFCRQIGSYPLIVSVPGQEKLNEFIDIKVKGWMLRSLIGEKI